LHTERDQKDSGASNEEALEELNTENMFLKRELEYAEKKLANLGAGDEENAGDENAEKNKELIELRKDKQSSQKEVREMNRTVNSQKMDISELREEMNIIMRERDAARVEVQEVKEAIKEDLAELEDDVSQQLTNKDAELTEANEKMDNYERQLDRMEKKCEFLMNENKALTGRENEDGGGGATTRGGKGSGAAGGDGGGASEEQLMYVKDQLDVVEKRHGDLQNKYLDQKSDYDAQIKDLERQLSQVLAQAEEYEEKAGHADELKEWLQSMSEEKEEALNEADQELQRLKSAHSQEKAVAISAAVSSMEERIERMEEELDDANTKSMAFDEELRLTLAQNEEHLSEVEGLEIQVSQMRFERRLQARSGDAGGGGGGGGGGGSSDVMTDHEREKQALLKQLQGMTEKVNRANEGAEELVNKERYASSLKLEEMRVKFAAEAAQFAAVKGSEVAAVQNEKQRMDGDKMQLQRVAKALGKSLKEKEEVIASIEGDLRDSELQLKNVREEKGALDEKLKQTTADLEEALELHDQEEHAWKEDPQVIRLERELAVLQAAHLVLEEQSLADLEELEAEKMKAFDEMVARKDAELEQLLTDASASIDERSAQKDQERALNMFKKFMKENFASGVMQALRSWSQKCNMTSVGGMERQVKLLEGELEEFKATDAARLERMRKNVQGDVVKLKDLVEVEKDAARAAQSQLLFITNMAKEQVEQAHGATALCKVLSVMAQWKLNVVHGIFEHWRLFTVTEQALRWREKIAVGVMQSSSSDKAVAVMKGIEAQRAQEEALEVFLINELQNEFASIVQSRQTVQKYQQAGVTADSVHTLELDAKRRAEKEWYVEKKKVQEELEELRYRMKTEQNVFNEMQAKLYIDKQGLEQQVVLMEKETHAVRSEFDKRQTEELEDMMLAREELLSVAYKSGFHMLHTLLTSWTHSNKSSIVKKWQANLTDTMRHNLHDREEQQTKFAEQLEATQYQSLIQTTQLTEQISQLSRQKGLDALKHISHRWAYGDMSTVLSTWKIQRRTEQVQASSQQEYSKEVDKVKEELNYKTIKVKVVALARLNFIMQVWKKEGLTRIMRNWNETMLLDMVAGIDTDRSHEVDPEAARHMVLQDSRFIELQKEAQQKSDEIEALREKMNSQQKEMMSKMMDLQQTAADAQKTAAEGAQNSGGGRETHQNADPAKSAGDADAVNNVGDISAASSESMEKFESMEKLKHQVEQKEEEIQRLRIQVEKMDDDGPGLFSSMFNSMFSGSEIKVANDIGSGTNTVAAVVATAAVGGGVGATASNATHERTEPAEGKEARMKAEEEHDASLPGDADRSLSSAKASARILHEKVELPQQQRDETGSSATKGLQSGTTDKLMQELWEAECELHSLGVDTQALEAEVERLEAELHGEEYEDQSQRLVVLAATLEFRPYLGYAANDSMDNFELELLKVSLVDAQNLVQEQAEENTLLEEEIERLEDELASSSQG